MAIRNALIAVDFDGTVVTHAYPEIGDDAGAVPVLKELERIWKATLKAAGIEHKKFHCLRHTHATQLLASGIPLLEVGHSKASHTLDLYGHAIPGYDEHLPEKIKNIYSL